jgi:hypothetical protein
MNEQAHSKPRTLVLEDEALIALDLHDELQDYSATIWMERATIRIG